MSIKILLLILKMQKRKKMKMRFTTCRIVTNILLAMTSSVATGIVKIQTAGINDKRDI